MPFYYTHVDEKHSSVYAYRFWCNHARAVYLCAPCNKNILSALCIHAINWQECIMCNKCFQVRSMEFTDFLPLEGPVFPSDHVISKVELDNLTLYKNLVTDKVPEVNSSSAGVSVSPAAASTPSPVPVKSSIDSEIKAANDWTIATRKNSRRKKEKRNVLFSQSPSVSQTANFSDKNVFNVLKVEKPVKQALTPPPPPPFFVSGVGKPLIFKKIVIDPLVKDAKMQIINRSQVKIVVRNSDDYNILLSHFKAEKLSFHTFQYKENKTVKRMIRGLPTDYPIEEIKSSLISQGLSVTSVTQIRHPITKASLPLFLFEANVTIDVTRRLEKIISINNLIVKIEYPQRKNTIPQCQNCLSYGHTKRYCYRSPRCVICGDLHASDQCVRKKDVENYIPLIPTCALCNGQHFGNYKGCKVHKDLRKKRLANFVNHKTVPSSELTNTSSVRNNVGSYANAVRNNLQSQSDNHFNINVTNSFNEFDKRLCALEKLVTSQSEQISHLLSIVSYLQQSINAGVV
ncbi:unnamed protein product [Bemisia tabaci]|uniref:Pre-C2HC domain-containing protein n=1 Tax=Bemisia tabaci TaxID=7038 RepID=A0A9P0F1F9_BEMTA|nr:unnamed protein product [Bemisia tabaci]